MAVKKERERELSISLPTTGRMGLRQRTDKEEIFLHVQAQVSGVAGQTVLPKVTRSYCSL